jgi:hypothetical protein
LIQHLKENPPIHRRNQSYPIEPLGGGGQDRTADLGVMNPTL